MFLQYSNIITVIQNHEFLEIFVSKSKLCHSCEGSILPQYGWKIHVS